MIVLECLRILQWNVHLLIRLRILHLYLLLHLVTLYSLLLVPIGNVISRLLRLGTHYTN